MITKKKRELNEDTIQKLQIKRRKKDEDCFIMGNAKMKDDGYPKTNRTRMIGKIGRAHV